LVGSFGGMLSPVSHPPPLSPVSHPPPPSCACLQRLPAPVCARHGAPQVLCAVCGGREGRGAGEIAARRLHPPSSSSSLSLQSSSLSGSVYSHFGPFTLQSRAARSSVVAAGRRCLKCEWPEGVNCRAPTSPPPRLLCLIRIGRCVAPAERRLLAKRAARLPRQPRPDALGVEVVLACEREHAISDNVPVGMREGAVVSTCMQA
jgi:hypothetical protein